MVVRFIERSGEIKDDMDELQDLSKEMIQLLTTTLSMFKSNTSSVGGMYSSLKRQSSLNKHEFTNMRETRNINPLDPESSIINCIMRTLDYHIELSQWVVINSIIKTLAEQKLFNAVHKRKLRQKAHILLTNLNDEGKATYDRFLESQDSSLLSELKSNNENQFTLTQQKFHSKLEWYHGDDEAVDLIKFNRCIRPLKGKLPLAGITRSNSRSSNSDASFIDGSGYAYYTQYLRLCAGVHQKDFEAKLKKLFPEQTVFVHLNSLQECFDLARSRCKHKPQPKASHLLDVISTLLVFDSPQHILDAKCSIENNFDVLMTVNCFRKDTNISEIFFGFRMLRTYVLLEKNGVFHVGEISLTLQDFFDLNTAAARFRSIRDLDFATGAKISHKSFFRPASFAAAPSIDLLARSLTRELGESQL